MGEYYTVSTWLDQFCLRDQGEKNHQILSKFANLDWGLMILDCFMNQWILTSMQILILL